MLGQCTITSTWLERYKDLYIAASDHKYFHLIKTGVVRKEEFEVWLMQHYLFSRMFARFVASLLNKTPKGPEFGEGHGDGMEMEMVLGSTMALDTEVKFLKGKAEELGLDWSTPNLKMHESNYSYCQLLHRLSQVDVPYSIGMMTLWSVASVFSLGWAMCAESPSTPCDLIECCQRWGDEGLLDFCGFLQMLAEMPLAMSPPEVVEEAETVFAELLKHQKSFMDIAIEIMEEMRTPEKERAWQQKLLLEQRDGQLELEARNHHHLHYVEQSDQAQQWEPLQSEGEDTEHSEQEGQQGYSAHSYDDGSNHHCTHSAHQTQQEEQVQGDTTDPSHSNDAGSNHHLTHNAHQSPQEKQEQSASTHSAEEEEEEEEEERAEKRQEGNASHSDDEETMTSTNSTPNNNALLGMEEHAGYGSPSEQGKHPVPEDLVSSGMAVQDHSCCEHQDEQEHDRKLCAGAEEAVTSASGCKGLNKEDPHDPSKFRHGQDEEEEEEEAGSQSEGRKGQVLSSKEFDMIEAPSGGYGPAVRTQCTGDRDGEAVTPVSNGKGLDKAGCMQHTTDGDGEAVAPVSDAKGLYKADPHSPSNSGLAEERDLQAEDGKEEVLSSDALDGEAVPPVSDDGKGLDKVEPNDPSNAGHGEKEDSQVEDNKEQILSSEDLDAKDLHAAGHDPAHRTQHIDDGEPTASVSGDGICLKTEGHHRKVPSSPIADPLPDESRIDHHAQEEGSRQLA
ncbi:hypothetical protein CBR_g45493 [Chara braunii]|uniref:Thiaminase-2/PQQC domain-containing protein n=1 Tax=Chara braunii TaxID=69332 RepID=A0A388LYT7_CHABU|nr:hypothetical protein CBR_g45493 [Chara braunii]|eukprot:GBG87435.1 hypothetical protein CBR_g45493 [Chara braunii]